MKRRCVIIVILIGLFLLIPFIAEAEDLDITQIGSIEINYTYGDTLIPGAEASLYKIASLNDEWKYNYIEGINEYNLNNLTASDQLEVSKKILGDIKNNDIQHLRSCTTESNGTCKFENLSVGVYLIDVKEIEIDKTTYSSLPTLVIVPTADEKKESLNYDTKIVIKVEAKTEGQTPSVDNNDESEKEQVKPNKEVKRPYTPNTSDNILFYAMMFGISLIVIILMIILIGRKKDKKNEKDN